MCPEEPPRSANLAPDQPDEEGWEVVRGLECHQAEELLDWLENQGYRERQVRADPADGFSVRWQRG